MEKICNFIFPGDEVEMEMVEVENRLNIEYLNKPFKELNKIIRKVDEYKINISLKVSQVIFKFGCSKYLITFKVLDELEYINRIILTIPIDKSLKGSNLIVRSSEATHYKEYLVNSITISHPKPITNYRNSYCKNLCWISKLNECNNLCKNCELKTIESNGFLIGDKVYFRDINRKEYKYSGIITGLCSDGTYGIYYEREKSFDRFNMERKLTGKYRVMTNPNFEFEDYGDYEVESWCYIPGKNINK